MGMVEGRQLLIRALPSATDIRDCVKHLMALNRAGVVEQNPGGIGLIASRVNFKPNYFKVHFFERGQLTDYWLSARHAKLYPSDQRWC